MQVAASLGIRRWVLFAVVLAGVLALLPGPVSAHANLARSFPAANAHEAKAPSEIRLWFTEPLEPNFSRFTVRAADGSNVELPHSTVDPEDAYQMFVPVATLPDGLYTVVWRALSTADGHSSEGSFVFTVGNAAMIDAEARSVGETLPLEGVLVRGFNFLSLSLGLGSLAFALFVWGPASLVQADAAERRLGRTIWLGWVLMGIAGVLVLLLQVSIAAGATLLQAAGDPALELMLTQTRYGSLWTARMAIWLLMGVALLLAQRDARLRWLALLAGMTILLLQSLFGHGSGVEDVGAAVAADWLHLLATVIWVGGLVAFGLVLGPVRRLGASAAAVASRLTAAFSQMVRVCVVALIITGVYATWLHVGSVAALVGTLYGWTLLIKLALFMPVLLLAAVNLLLTSRRLRAEQPVWVGRLRGLVGAEVALTLAILVAAAALTAGSPARGTQAMREQVPVLPQPIPYFGMEVTPAFMAHLEISPGWVGENEFRIGLYAPDGSMIEDASLIRLRFDSRGQAVGQSELRPESTGDGYYSISGANLSLPGTWRIRMTVARPGEFDTVMDFEPTISPPPPTAYPPLDLRIPLDERALATGMAGLLLVLVGGFFAVQGRAHWRYGGLWGGFVLVLVGGALLITTTANLGVVAAQSGGLVARDAWMLPWNAGMTGAVYLSINNGTGEDDALINAMTDAAEVVELHRSQLDVGKMSPVDGLTIPAGGSLAIAPENYHLMLINMQRDVAVGDSVNVILHFRSGATLNVLVPVVATIPEAE